MANAIGFDQRIGSKILNVGPGFGGKAAKRHPEPSLFIEFYGLNEVASFWNEVLNLNNWQKKRIS